MSWSRFLGVILVAVLFSLSSLPAQAHKLNVFCWTGDQQIYGEVFFSGGRKAKNIPVYVQGGKSLTSLQVAQTDEEGKFQFAPPQQAVQQKLDLLISVDSGDGHRGEWPLKADEYFSLKDAPLPALQKKDQLAPEALDAKAVRKIVLQELNRELAPIKQHLAEGREKKVNPQDILGGIGCIIGMAGILAWFQSKKKKKKSTNGQ